MNLIKMKNTVKNSIKEEYDIPQDIDLLNKWTIPKIEPKVIYRLGTFEKLGLKQVVKTTEESISLDNDEMIIKLLSNDDINHYKFTHKFLHIGLVQIAFKPLTLEGLPESFIAVLRDSRNLNWKQSLIGIIQTSLAHGPVYFDVYPNLQLSLSDKNILDALTLNVKTHGYNYAQGSEVMCICYRIYFKPLHTLNPQCKRINKPNNETILIETNFDKSNISTRRTVKWEEIVFPENWLLEQAVPRQPRIETNLTSIIQTPDGNVEIQFDNKEKRSQSDRYIRGRSYSQSNFSPLDYKIELPLSSRASTSHIPDSASQIRDHVNNNRVEELNIDNNNIVSGSYETNGDETISQMNFSI